MVYTSFRNWIKISRKSHTCQTVVHSVCQQNVTPFRKCSSEIRIVSVRTVHLTMGETRSWDPCLPAHEKRRKPASILGLQSARCSTKHDINQAHDNHYGIPKTQFFEIRSLSGQTELRPRKLLWPGKELRIQRMRRGACSGRPGRLLVAGLSHYQASHQSKLGAAHCKYLLA